MDFRISLSKSSLKIYLFFKNKRIPIGIIATVTIFNMEFIVSLSLLEYFLSAFAIEVILFACESRPTLTAFTLAEPLTTMEPE